MVCRHCGARLQQGVIICPECGTRQRRRASVVRCAYCHSRVPVDLSVCPRCGRNVRPAGPRWGAWIVGAAVVGLAGLWVLGRLPVAQIRADVARTRGEVISLVQIPELPTAAPTTTAGVGANVMWSPLATPTVPAITPTVEFSATAPSVVTTSVATTTMTITATQTLSSTLQPTEAVATPTAPTETPTATATPAPTETSTPTLTPTPEGLYYTVRDGDTLSVIGERTGIPWQTIAKLNGLSEWAMLSVGQTLKLPTPTPAPSPTSASSATPSAPAPTPTATPTALTPTATPTAPAPTATPTATATPVKTTQATRYQVQSGDTLQTIGDSLGIPWETIAAANGITGQTMLSVGQELIIPGSDTPLPTRTPTPPVTPTNEPTAEPTIPPTAELTLPAPVLTSPGSPDERSGSGAMIVLEWQPVPGMPADARYQVIIRYTENGSNQMYYGLIAPNDRPGMRFPPELWSKADQPARQYTWSVRVVRVSTDGKGGERLIELSPESPPRIFYWH